jgi:hypothetical protein
MKTTIDLPDSILEQAKRVAVQRKTTIEELVIHSLLSEIGTTEGAPDDTEAFVAAFARGNNTEFPVGKVHRHEIYDRPIFHRL